MRISSRYFLCLVVFVAGITLGEAQAQQVHRWIEKELATGSYKLSEYEENGLYYCSSAEQKIVDTRFENGYALIVFEHAAPRFFLQREISPDLLKKLQAIQLEQFYHVLCVHSFFRDDWQNRYDEDHTVSDRLLNIKKQDKELVDVR
ncbi:MAG TPA: hypothetical protein VK208_09965 [Pyrinomonadaceae bacterium]|nr:hypothetical protein [Pyrinomonadaceae bacterium]